MTTLRRFSEKETHYHYYQARQNFLRQQRTIQGELDAEREARSREQQERVQIIKTLDAVMLREKTERLAKETALQREAAALAEIEKLKAQLNQTQK